MTVGTSQPYHTKTDDGRSETGNEGKWIHKTDVVGRKRRETKESAPLTCGRHGTGEGVGERNWGG